MERYKQFFTEFVVADISSFKNYLSMTSVQKGEDVLRSHSYVIDEYVDWITNTAYDLGDDEMISLIDGSEWDQVVDKLIDDSNYRKTLKCTV